MNYCTEFPRAWENLMEAGLCEDDVIASQKSLDAMNQVRKGLGLDGTHEGRRVRDDLIEVELALEIEERNNG